MPLPYTKVVLIEGDHWPSQDTLARIKGWLPGRWTEFRANPRNKVDSFELEPVLDALATRDFDDTAQVVLMRGLPNRKEIREGLLAAIPRIQTPATLIIWDAYGIMAANAWDELRAKIKEYGRVITVAPPLANQAHDVQISAIMGMSKRHNLKLSFETAAVLLDWVGADRGLLESAVEDLAWADMTEPTVDQIRQVVLPGAVDIPVWEFYAALNSGSHARITTTAEGLRKNKYNPDIIMSFAVKQCRWQVLAAHLQAQGKPVADGLRDLGGSKDELAAVKRLHRYKPDRKLLRNMAEEDLPKREMLTAEPMLRDVAAFVKDVLPRSCPHGTDPVQWALHKCLERYGVAYEAMVDLREFGSEVQFGMALRSLSVVR